MYEIEERIAIMMEGTGKTEEQAKKLVKLAWLEEVKPEMCEGCEIECMNCPELPMILKDLAQ